MFPPSFDPEIYKKHKDLSEFSLEKLISHYKVHGKNEGRLASNISKKDDLIKVLDSDKTLKISNHNDVNNYYCVKTKKFVEKTLIRNNIDYSNDRKYNFVINDLDINYELNIVSHLENIYNILENEGFYIIVIPDKRYSFEHYIKETDITDVLEDYYGKRDKNSIKTLIQYRCYTTHNDPKRHWLNDHGKKTIDENKFFLKYTLNEHLDKNKEQLNVHNYQFTPDSFKEIFTKLVFLELTKFTIEEIYPTLRNSNEFFVVLKK